MAVPRDIPPFPRPRIRFKYALDDNFPMTADALRALLYNAALLLAVVAVFDIASRRQSLAGNLPRQLVSGLILGFIGIGIMTEHFRLVPGIIFDTRSVLLGVSGIFLGPVPTVLAMAMTALFRAWQGGAATLSGISVILATGVLGILWGHYRRSKLASLHWSELYLFGLVIHLVMLALMLLLPWESARTVLLAISGPVLLIYPIATAALGMLMVHRLRREQEQLALQQQQTHLREQAALLDAANDAIYIADDQLTVRYWNQGAVRLYGWSVQEALGQSVQNLTAAFPETFALARDQVLHHHAWSGELRVRHRHGQERIVLARWTRLPHRPADTLCIDTDVTEVKNIEQQFLRAQRLEGIGSLASGIAHDLNNILTPMLVSSQLLQETTTDPEDRATLACIEASAHRGADLVRQLLTFAQGKPTQRTPIDFRTLLREVEQLIRNTFPRQLNLVVAAAEDLWPVVGDPTQLHQALMNLCVNARDAMPQGGLLRVQADNITLTPQQVSPHPGALPGPTLRLTVSDTGTGIASHDLDRIFDPFFTTKAIGKGTGLGLPTVLGIVRGHGGFIVVETHPGQGSTFQVHLPASPNATPTPPNPPPPRPNFKQGNQALVLVVDDELPVRLSLERTLASRGYRVLTAEHGAAALALYQQHHPHLHAVITDMMMPVMDGPTFLLALRQIHPSLPVFSMSGIPPSSTPPPPSPEGFTAQLSKPFSPDELFALLAQFCPTTTPPADDATVPAPAT